MKGRNTKRVAVALVAVACCLTAAVVAAPAVAQESTQHGSIDGTTAPAHGDGEPAFAVSLEPNGTGQVHVTYAFDLTDADRRAAFEELRDNETATAAFESRFQERIGGVAADAATTTGREMSVDGLDLAFRTVDDTGVVDLSFSWHGLAAVEDDSLVVTEPFASGFEPDRPVHLRGPGGGELTSATPTPATETDGWHTWDAGTDFTGFEAVFEATDSTSGGDSDGSVETDGGIGPGFGVVAPVLGILAALALVGRRRS